MMARGIGYSVAGRNCGNDPEEGQQRSSDAGGLGSMVALYLKKAVARLTRGPDLSDLDEVPGRVGSETDR